MEASSIWRLYSKYISALTKTSKLIHGGPDMSDTRKDSSSQQSLTYSCAWYGFINSTNTFGFSSLIRQGLDHKYVLNRNRLDAAYMVFLELYFQNTVHSVKLALISIHSLLPTKAVAQDWVLDCVKPEHDPLAIVSFHSEEHAKLQFSQISDFLHDATRSKLYSLREQGPALYANAAIACFGYLYDIVADQGPSYADSDLARFTQKGAYRTYTRGSTHNEFSQSCTARHSAATHNNPSETNMSSCTRDWIDDWDGEFETYTRGDRIIFYTL